MNNSEPTPDKSSPSQRAVALAAIACFVSLMAFNCVAHPIVDRLNIRWAELLAYSTVPLAVTFIILYRSGWHREITGAARTCCLLLLAGFILGCELVGVGFMICLALFCANAMSGGNH